MDRQFGLGLTGLIHPLTGEWNHEAAIKSFGGRPEKYILGDTKSMGLHHVIGKLHGLTQPTKHLQVQKEYNWILLGGKLIDTYDLTSWLYGMVISMSSSTNKAEAAKSDCFYATYTTVAQIKFMLEELIDFPKTWNWFNLFIYIPTHQWNNSMAMYEYCNIYLYIVQL